MSQFSSVSRLPSSQQRSSATFTATHATETNTAEEPNPEANLLRCTSIEVHHTARSTARKSCKSECSSETVSNYAVSGLDLSKRKDMLYPFSSQGSCNSTWGALTRSSSGTPVHISYNMTPFSSTSSTLTPSCRVCQCPEDPNNCLINPCRCDGSLKYIHGTCLRKWIEVSARKKQSIGPPYCELCGYVYRKHKYVKCHNYQCPSIPQRDKALHIIFIVSLIIMLICAIATVMCFITDKEKLGKYKSDHNERAYLSRDEIITLSCGVIFFVSFFVAMSVEIKAKRTIYQIFRKCIRHNTVWIIESYDAENDVELKNIRRLNAIKGQEHTVVPLPAL